ncbi:hypothetical protein UlMin_024929 [Ulmus minor]
MSTAPASDEESPMKMKLSPAARLFQSPKFNCYIVAIMGCNTIIDPEVIKEGLKHTLLKHPRFSSKLVITKNKLWEKKRWSPTPVNLEEHVFVPKFDSKIDNPNQFVEDYISHMTTSPLDMSKPLWELHLLNLKCSQAESLGVFRIHHSVGDGASLMSLLLACTRKTSDPEALPTLPTTTKHSSSSDHSSPFWWFLLAAWYAIVMIWNTFVDVMVFAMTILFLKDTNTPIKGAEGVELTTKRFVHRSISLDQIKFIKKAMNTTVNDVLLGVTQAGLSRYLNRRYATQNGKDEGTSKKINYLPKGIRLRATILVNLRPTIGIQALADMMSKKSKTKWGNLIGYLLLPFTIALQENPLDYVRTAKATIDRKKHSFEAICTHFCAQLLLRTIGVELTAPIARRAIFNTTVAFSNMVGPQEDISFYGHPIAFLAPSVYGHPHALTIHFQSFINKMIIVLAVDPNVIPDPQQLFGDIEESLKLILEATIKQELPKEAV